MESNFKKYDEKYDDEEEENTRDVEYRVAIHCSVVTSLSSTEIREPSQQCENTRGARTNRGGPTTGLTFPRVRKRCRPTNQGTKLHLLSGIRKHLCALHRSKIYLRRYIDEADR